MGMMGHAMVTTGDGSVFVHLHPVGMISMAAQEALTGSMEMMDHGAREPTSEVRFPVLLPKAGDYRIWVQLKTEGQVRTAVFDRIVE